MTAISELENKIREYELRIALTQDEIKSIESTIEKYSIRRVDKIKLINNIDEAVVEFNEAIDILKGETK